MSDQKLSLKVLKYFLKGAGTQGYWLRIKREVAEMKKDLYYLKVLTPLHVGTGQGMGHIDLPIYREAHTDFPAIPASAIKGTVRTKELIKLYMEKRRTNEDLKLSDLERAVEEFDPKEDKEELDKDIKRLAELLGSRKKEGSIIFTDARILLFPVKSLKGVYALITCPYVLERFAEETGKEKPSFNGLDDSSCIVFEESQNKLDDENVVVLEEFAFETNIATSSNVENLLNDQKIDKSRVVIVSDNVFTHMVKSYTEVQTHIKVDIEKGTVEDGALWTEEYVPAEAVFYFLVFRKENEEFSITNSEDENIFQLGGNTSTGKGFVEVWKDGGQKS
ncbi:MAG: type III-B CRISPR module RAMP protein Cmr4 [Aquificota bacterium]|nr:type III-B CRISPR module RAMP protein Cmr4 [Aquificota bacterium]